MALHACTTIVGKSVRSLSPQAAIVPAMGRFVRWRGKRPKRYPVGRAKENRMKFGIFMAPFHRAGENPTLCFERDLELIEWLDRTGYDEVFIGEHHSSGWEIISSPDIFIAAAAGRTRRIMLGSGVVSVPYHNPFNIANRYALLDHLTRGRVMLGCGPGALAADAHMLGIDTTQQRRRTVEGVRAIMRLFTEEGGITLARSFLPPNE